jgi:hypothetical protein
MKSHIFEQSVATGIDLARPEDVTETAATGIPSEVLKLVGRTPRLNVGPLMAAVVLSAAITSATAIGFAPVVMDSRRRRDDVVAESDTSHSEYEQELFVAVMQLFEQGSSEFFYDGVRSQFSSRLLAFVAQYRSVAFQVIADYLFSAEPNPDVVSEALRWLADFRDPATFAQRWHILARMIRDRSSRVRDGAVLGLAALDDPRARPLLTEARDVEQVAELRRLIDAVIRQLDATANATAARG